MRLHGSDRLAWVRCSGWGTLYRGGGVLLASIACMSSCDTLSLSGAGSPASQRQTTEFVVVSPAQSWVLAPDALLTRERRMVGVGEQRITLTNETAIAGENVLMVIARSNGSGAMVRFSLEDFLRRSGGAPYPFQNLGEGDLLTAEDSLGFYTWAQEDMGPGTVCVLAIRTLRASMRQMPRGADAMDVMLRNCVRGDAAAALAPIASARVGQGPGSYGNVGLTQPRMLSPLAAPSQ